MKPRLVIIFLLLVLVPLALLAWLGLNLARGERQRLREQFGSLLAGQLLEADAGLARLMQERERRLADLARDAPLEPELLRERARGYPWIHQVFLIQPDGALGYPSPRGPLSDGERAFLERTQEIWNRGELPTAKNASSPSNEKSLSSLSSLSSLAQQRITTPSTNKGAEPERAASGWHAWYWGNGLNLIYWARRADGWCVGAELDRTRLLADLIGQLPETNPARPQRPEGRIRLLDSNNNVLYQWGAYDPGPKDRPAAGLVLSPPLGSWRLDYYVRPGLLDAGRAGLLFNLLAGLGAAGAALIGLAYYFYRENTRALREAAQRVSFVNQVSHELKTPLTNIRLYAELLQERLGEEDEHATRHVGVIVAECERLTRLIGNVLSFSRARRVVPTLHMTPGRVGEIVERVAERFRPALERRGVALTISSAGFQPAMEAGKMPALLGGDSADPVVRVAADAVEQIVGNLLSNVEKYAAGGGAARIECAHENGATTIVVADCGPGIPAGEREKIFAPFYRISSAVNEGVSGAGIGLSIARELARLHGGDLTLEPTERGARFVVRLGTEEEK